MDAALVLGGFAMGLASTPHCAVMCGAPCAAVTRGNAADTTTFVGGRLVGYMAGGAIAAGSLVLLSQWVRQVPLLQPVWSLLHLTLLCLGLWWLLTGRSWERRAVASTRVHIDVHPRRPVRSGLAGLAWVAWPCAALQGALILASLGSAAPAGALVMGSFAIASTPGLVAVPWLRARLSRWRRGPTDRQRLSRWATRAAGGALVVSSGWALASGVWARIAMFCAS